MLVDNCYLLNYSVLKQLQQILILAHFHCFYLIDDYFRTNTIISLFLLTLILTYSHPYVKHNTILNSVHVNLYWWIIFYRFIMFFNNNLLKIILYIWNRIWFIRDIKFIISGWSRCFKYIVLVFTFNIFPCVVNR